MAGASEMMPKTHECKCNSCVMGFNGTNGNGYQPCASKLKRPPTVGRAIKGGDFPEPPRTPKPPPTSNDVVDNGSSIMLDHVAAFVFGSAFGLVVGVVFVGMGKLL